MASMVGLRTTLAATTLVVAMLVSSAAMACRSDDYDWSQELDAINKALPSAQLTAPERAETGRLLHIASASRVHLTMAGILLQSDARGKILAKLGIDRIPARPEREFQAIKDKLQGLSPLNESQTEAARLRDEAETLWSGRQYEKSRQALNQALKLLGITIPHFRC
jgi:hypothetical protein